MIMLSIIKKMNKGLDVSADLEKLKSSKEISSEDSDLVGLVKKFKKFINDNPSDKAGDEEYAIFDNMKKSIGDSFTRKIGATFKRTHDMHGVDIIKNARNEQLGKYLTILNLSKICLEQIIFRIIWTRQRILLFKEF